MARSAHSRLAPIAMLALLTLVSTLAPAEPQAPSTEQSADAKLATRFIGRNYDDELEVEGWNDLGGGLVAPPIFIHEYQRDDGTYLVLTSREISKDTSTAPASFEVTDALVVPSPQTDVEFSIACVQGQDETLRILGLAKGAEDQEWWNDVRQAWEISLDTGKIASTKTKGVRCTNVSWGQ